MIVDYWNSKTEIAQQHDAKRTNASIQNRRAQRPALLALLVWSLVAGCGKAHSIKYYQLSMPPELASAPTQALPVDIIVHLPTAPALYRDTRVVYGVGDQQMGAYEYERWAAPPTELIQGVFVRSLRATGHYAGVFTPQAKVNGDYALATEIYDFKEQDNGGSLVGRLSLNAQLRNLKTGEIVWHSSYAHDEPIGAKTVPEVAAALNRDVQLAATNISTGLDQYFAAHPPSGVGR